jgi:hypothetical protein
MWKEMNIAYFKVISRHLPEGTEEDDIHNPADIQTDTSRMKVVIT